MNLILIAIDTLRADHLGCYGYERETSPAIDALAREGAVFTSFWAPCIPTHPAFTSIFAGTHAITHGVVAQARDKDRLPEDIRTLPEILRGKMTTAAIDNLARKHHWFTRGYDHYIFTRASTAEWVTEAAMKWLKTYGNKPFFLFLHPWDPHAPYVPPQEYRNLFHSGDGKGGDPEMWEAVTKQIVYPFFRWFHYERMGNPTDLEYIAAQYDSEIRYCDDCLGRFFDWLKSSGLWDETAIIITSDHGESMTEHLIFFEHHGIYDCVLHVPFIVRLPQGGKAGVRVDGMFQHIDIAPTVCDILGVKPARQFEGRSLLPAIRGEDIDDYDAIYACEASRMAKWAIRTKDWKLIKNIDAGQYYIDYDELYHVAEDPSETKNLIEEHPEVADRLELRLNRWRDERLGVRPDPVRLVAAEGSPLQHVKDEGLKELGMSFEEWKEFYKRRFVFRE